MAPRRTTEVDWFSEHAPAWERLLVPRFAGKPAVNALVVGPYEGRCVRWLFERVLTGRRSKATVVAAFAAYEPCVSYLGKGVWNPAVRAAFERNTRPYASAITLLDKAGTDEHDHLRRLAVKKNAAASFDFIYVDTHSSRHALETAVMVFPLLAAGGVLCLTNYVHSKEHDWRCPRRGVDAFVDCYASDVRVLLSGFHHFVERRLVPLKGLPCHSEFYPEPERPVACKSRASTRSSK